MALEELKATFEAAGQGHVFAQVDQLSAEEAAAFEAQLQTVDLDWVKERYEQYLREKDGVHAVPNLEPAPVIALPQTDGERLAETEARTLGEEALRAGKVGAFLVAGGQGTRLGFNGPKGCYPLGPVTGRTLFQWHAEQIRARAQKYETIIPWYIMTSQANDADTRAFFVEHDYFGLNKDDVMFFAQAMVPAVDFEGKLILDGKGSLAMSPNGHGGSLKALVDSGATADMKKRGVEVISYFQVDNPLTTICDPVFVGYHLKAGAEMSSKVLEKAYPEEKVGAIGYIDGTLGVIEYSDLDEENMYAKDENGRLKFWAGSIAIHMLGVDFVERAGAGGALPWHIAIKKIPCLDGDGNPIKPEENNGVKFETFVFDALPLAKESITMEVVREDEFAPVKNASGIDSAESSRQLLSSYAARLLKTAKADVQFDKDGHCTKTIEMSYLFALDEEEIRERVDGSLVIDDELVLD